MQPAVLARGPRDESLAVELLPHSGVILSVNGTAMRTWNATRKAATAQKPDHAHAAAQFLRPWEETGFFVGERAMSAQEIDELLAHAPPLSRLDLLLGSAVVALSFVSWWHALAFKSPTLFLPIVSSIAACWLGGRAVRRWRSHRLFARDLAHGRILISQHKGDGGLPGPVIEWLPHSGWLWSEGHRPATWRRAPLWRRTYVRRDR